MALAFNRRLTAKAERKYTGVVIVDMWKALDRAMHSATFQ